MISVPEARKLILKNSKLLPKSKIGIAHSLGQVMSENIASPLSLPPFDQSAMDGYALKYSDYIQKGLIKVIGEIAAGTVFKKAINTGQAVRIFTGAQVPVGADTVVVQEKVSVENGCLIINDLTLQQGANIRKTGSQIKKGKIALPNDGDFYC
jgi:molybdopterin molybdotransferase